MMLGILFVLMSTTMLGVSTTPAPKIDPLTTTKTAFNIKYMFYSNRMKLSLDRMSRLKQQNIKSHFPPPDPQQIAEEIHLIYKYGIKLGENPPVTPFSLIQCDWFGKQRHYGYFSLRQCFPRTVWDIDDQFVKRVFFRIIDLCFADFDRYRAVLQYLDMEEKTAQWSNVAESTSLVIVMKKMPRKEMVPLLFMWRVVLYTQYGMMHVVLGETQSDLT